MRDCLFWALGLVTGFVLAVIVAHALASTATSRQASVPRPAQADIRRVEVPARTEAPTLRPSPSATIGTRSASPEAQPSAKPTAAPTPKPTKRPRATTRPAGGLRGLATWFAAPRGTAAAGPALRAALGKGWRGDRVRVCSGGECVTVRLTDWCACGPRHGVQTVIDLGRDSFARLAPLSRGIIDVTIR